MCAADIIGFAKDAEKALENAGIAASFRKDATYRVQPSGPAANAYRYSRTGRAIVIKRGKSAWTLIDVHRISVWPREKGMQKLTLTIDQKLRVLNRFMKTFHISATEIAGVLGFSSETDHLHKQIVRA